MGLLSSERILRKWRGSDSHNQNRAPRGLQSQSRADTYTLAGIRIFMLNHLLPLPLLSLCGLVVAAGPHWSLAEDPFAFPKYRVSFLNGLPVLNETAERWIAHGLKGGEREFLDQSWRGSDQNDQQAHVVQSIDSGDASPEVASVCVHPPAQICCLLLTRFTSYFQILLFNHSLDSCSTTMSLLIRVNCRHILCSECVRRTRKHSFVSSLLPSKVIRRPQRNP